MKAGREDRKGSTRAISSTSGYLGKSIFGGSAGLILWDTGSAALLIHQSC